MVDTGLLITDFVNLVWGIIIDTMNAKSFYNLIGVIFSLIFILHSARIVFGWGAVIGTVVIPMWASYVAIAISAFLLYQIYKLKK